MKYFLLFLVVCCFVKGVSANEPIKVHVAVFDADTESAIPARLYLEDESGNDFFFETLDPNGSAYRFEKQHWLNENSVEYHTTISAHPCEAIVPSGEYRLTVERGKTYKRHKQVVTVGKQDLHLVIRLKRWCDPESRGWYSGDLHLHREIDELRNVMLAENLNVSFPLTNWVTKSDTLPTQGDKNSKKSIPNELIEIDANHVIWPRNTEYEIFSVGPKQHTLGALFVLGHQGGLTETVPPWKPVVQNASQSGENVLLDMDKLAWPFSMLLPVLAPNATYELANNHLWRTEFAFRKWTTPAPSFMVPPFGASEGGERDWIDFTLEMYYSLLNCGFRLPPSAGTANGVHPVPAGFGRVYVNLGDHFDFESWKEGLQAGRSFVTTGPMVFAKARGQHPGEVFEIGESDDDEIALDVKILSGGPVSYAELIVNGKPEKLLRTRSEITQDGAYQSTYQVTVHPKESGWFAIRVFEEPEVGRVRFAHTAPWYVEKVGDQVSPTRDQRDYLISRMQDEMRRSRDAVSEEAMSEYKEALGFYSSLPIADESIAMSQSRPLDDAGREFWLRNMIVDHQFSANEVRQATGMQLRQAEREFKRLQGARNKEVPLNQIRVLPYPGGRHPRRGFLEGAIDPQRETKVSIFPPWAEGGYVVVDVPEAIFSNLGLTYLAHRHVPTIWTDLAIDLEKTEWKIDGRKLSMHRILPNQIAFSSHVTWDRSSVSMTINLVNGTDEVLTQMRVQVCTMLKALVGFHTQTRREEYIEGPFVAVKANDLDRWVITAWTPFHRSWTNPPVPCLHSDPQFPDCPPGEMVSVKGKLWFYEGKDIEKEVQRLRQENEG
ncbi:CehA/McbA family metallohydrolase [bacterium]|nr:CehA/McbA family metallohydrolase [bacterium]